MDTITLFHGSQRWQGPPALQPAGKGKSDYGSGLNLTTSLDTARKYAKGGGKVLAFVLPADLTFANNTKIPLDESLEFLDTLPRLKHRKDIKDDLRTGAARVGGNPFAYQLENLLINYDALKGEKGPALARFLVSQGVDASIVSHSAEDYLILFNLDKIIRYYPVAPSELQDSPRISRQY